MVVVRGLRGRSNEPLADLGMCALMATVDNETKRKADGR